MKNFLKSLSHVPQGSYASLLENSTQRRLDEIEQRGGQVQMQQAINTFLKRGYIPAYDDPSETITLHAPGFTTTCRMCGADVSGAMCYACGSAQ